jgi:hypothetical protein
MAEPFSHDDELAKQGETERKQLVLDYKSIFGGEKGQRVLADLERLFGFNKPSGTMGAQHGDVMLREGMKMPIYHIRSRLNMTFSKPLKQRTRALSKESPAQ